MKYADSPGVRAEIPRVLGNRYDRPPGASQQQRIESLLVAIHQNVECTGHRKHDMEILDREQVLVPIEDPLFFLEKLTLRTMPIPARVIRDARVAALLTRFAVSA